MTTHRNWRPRDFWWFIGLLNATAAAVEFESYAAAVIGAGLTLLQLVEMVLHSVADAMKGDGDR